MDMQDSAIKFETQTGESTKTSALQKREGIANLLSACPGQSALTGGLIRDKALQKKTPSPTTPFFFFF